MKKLLYTVIAAMPFCGSSLLMTSCDDLFDTKSPSSMDDSNIFSITSVPLKRDDLNISY